MAVVFILNSFPQRRIKVVWYASSAPMGIYSRHALKVGVDINKLHFRKDSVLDSIVDIKQESSPDILLLFNCIEI